MEIFIQHLQKPNASKKWKENTVPDINDAFY